MTPEKGFSTGKASSSNGLEHRPKLRFPGHEKQWSCTKLSCLFRKITAKNAGADIKNVICNSAKRGLVPQREYFDKDIVNSDNTTGYYVIEKNDFVYNPRKSQESPYGPVSRYILDAPGIVSPLYLCFRANKDVNTDFFSWYFHSPAWYRYIYMTGDSGARHDRVSIKDNDFFAMPICLPSSEEQNKIAAFLDLLETRIEKQQNLVESLKKYKRGLLSAIFERRLRFKAEDGSEFPEWGQKRLGDLMDFKNGVNASREAFQQGGIKCIGVTDVYAGNPIYSCNILGSVALSERQRAEYAVEYGDVLFQRSSETQEDIGHAAVYMDKYQPAVFNGFVIRGKKRDEYHPLYLHFELQTDFVRRQTIRLGAGAQHYNIGQESLATISVNMPSLPEQEKIASFLGIVDKKIGVEGAKIKTLQSIKRGLLQQLFI